MVDHQSMLMSRFEWRRDNVVTASRIIKDLKFKMINGVRLFVFGWKNKSGWKNIGAIDCCQSKNFSMKNRFQC